MKALTLILIACISLITAAAFAHGDEQHVMGTVAAVAKDSITVKTAANALVTVAVVPQTTFTKNKAAAKLADLNVGDRVVIHAKEPTEGKLVADTVQFSAPTTKAAPVPSK
jgi:ribosomal protein S1